MKTWTESVNGYMRANVNVTSDVRSLEVLVRGERPRFGRCVFNGFGWHVVGRTGCGRRVVTGEHELKRLGVQRFGVEGVSAGPGPP